MSPAKRATTAKRASTRTKKEMDREVSLPSETDQIQADSSALAESYPDTGAADEVEERIRLKAYEIYCSRNGGEGSAMDDWLAAEREVRFGGSDAEQSEQTEPTERAGHGPSLIEPVSDDAERDVAR